MGINMRTNKAIIRMSYEARKNYVFATCETEKKEYASLLAGIGARCGVQATKSKDRKATIIRIVTERSNKEKARRAGFRPVNDEELGSEDFIRHKEFLGRNDRETILLNLFISLWMAEEEGADFALSSVFMVPHYEKVKDENGQSHDEEKWFSTMEVSAWERYIEPRMKAWHFVEEKSNSFPHKMRKTGGAAVTIGTDGGRAVEEGTPYPGMVRETIPVSTGSKDDATKMKNLDYFLEFFPEDMKRRGVTVEFRKEDTGLIVRKKPDGSAGKRNERSRLGAFIPPVRIENLLPDTAAFKKKTMTASEVEEILKDNLAHAMASTYTGKMDMKRLGELDGEEISPRSSAKNSLPYNPEKEGIALYRMSCERTIEAYGKKLTWNEGYGRPLVIGDGGITIRLIEDTDSEGYASAMDVQHVTAEAAVEYDAVRKVVQELIIRNMIMKGIPLMEGDGCFRYIFHPHDARNSSTKEFEMTISDGRMEIHQIENESEDDCISELSRDLVGSVCLDGETWHDICHTNMLFIPETESISDPQEKLKKVKETFTGFRYFRDGNDTFYCAGKGKGAYHGPVAVFPNIYRTDLPPETIESMLSTYAIRLNDETSLPWQFAFIRRYAESLEEHNVPQEKKEEDKEKKEKKKK